METERLIAALEEAISYLRRSESSGWSNMPIEEIVRKLETVVNRVKVAKPIDVIMLDRLFAPTGVIQEISIDNGWGTKFLRISEIVDEFVGR
jgi:hypothetical protein